MFQFTFNSAEPTHEMLPEINPIPLFIMDRMCSYRRFRRFVSYFLTFFAISSFYFSVKFRTLFMEIISFGRYELTYIKYLTFKAL
jgi:hypothetical protein